MRISDWSSDVCSSDLPTAPTAPKPTRIPPIVTLDAKFFWDGADQEQFLGQKCGDCGLFTFPPRPMCPQCFSLNRKEVPLSGDRKSTRLNSSPYCAARMPSSACKKKHSSRESET